MKAKKNSSNLGSPNSITLICNLKNLEEWFASQVKHIESRHLPRILKSIATNLDEFVRWPAKAMLLWPGCTRATKYHKYTDTIKRLAKEQTSFRLDGRVNGPAIAAFCLSGGIRPKRYGSHNAWSVHHIYSGKFPYWERESTLHASHENLHCTQSAGLVAIHPIADQICDEYPQFSWLLRALAFKKFGYDPDQVFARSGHDEYGFVRKRCEVIPHGTVTPSIPRKRVPAPPPPPPRRI